MPDTGSPHENEEKDLASSDLVSPRSSHHASRSSTPGLSSLDGTPRYLNFMPNDPPRSGSAPPTSRSDMATIAAYLLEPNSQTTPGQITLEQVSSERALPSTMHRPQHQRDAVAKPSASSTNDLEDVACLSEITHLLRLQKYHKRRCLHAQDNLHRLQLAAAKSARLRLTARSVQHTLAECIKSEDKASFASLLHAFQDACEDVSRPSRAAAAAWDQGVAATDKPFDSFLSNVSLSAKDALLAVLTKLRYDGHFLAERLIALSTKELNALLPERTTSKSGDSVFASASRTSRSSRPVGYAVDAQVDFLTACAYGSPLETLVFASGSSAHTDSLEHKRSTEIWATVCARIVSEQKPGSEKLIPALMDIWSTLAPWPGKRRLEMWMLQTLQNGAFLLEQQHKQSFRARVEGRPDLSIEEQTRTEAFYTKATESLLDLFADQTGPSVIPPGAVSLSLAMFQKLRDSPSHQRALPSFVLTRWLFSTFIVNAINLPESHGLLTDHYVSDVSRQRILREVVTRAQKAVFDVSYYWKHGSPIMAETVHRVNALMTRLSQPESPAGSFFTNTVPDPAPFVVVSLRDATTIFTALYPQRRPMSISSDHEASTPGLHSSASSISGFSLFQNSKSPDQGTRETLNPFVWPKEAPNHSLENLRSTLAAEATEDDQLFRHSCAELEDIAARRDSNTKGSWEILVIGSERKTLRTERDECAGIREAQRASLNAGWADSGDDADREVISSLGKLLYKYGPHDLVSQASSHHATSSQTWSHLELLFETAINDCQARSDYVGAQRWFQRFHDVHAAILSRDSTSVLRRTLRALHARTRQSVNEFKDLETIYSRWAATVQATSITYVSHLQPILQANEALRDKMWYIADVRTSSTYEEARLIASALRVMGKPHVAVKPRAAQSLRHWSTSRNSTGSLHLKSEAQILDILSAQVEHGGPNKLSDDQAKATMNWMQRESIDNLCSSEERLHRFYFEVRKCVDLVSSSSAAENTLLWSSVLFARDSSLRQRESSHRKSAFLPGLYGSTLSSDYLSLSSQLRSNECLSSTSHTLSNSSSRDYLEARSPTLTNRSSMPFWSPATSEVDSPSSGTSIFSSHTRSITDVAPVREPSNLVIDSQTLEKLRQRVTSLILSDLTSSLFSDGSETDRAFWTGLGLELAERHCCSIQAWHSSAGSQTPTADVGIPARPSMMRFDYDYAFDNLLQTFSACSNPSTKLTCLWDMDRLMVPYMMTQRDQTPLAASSTRAARDIELSLRTTPDDATGMSVAGFRNLFSKNSMRPAAIFRDLQSIASLLPAGVLQNTSEGRAFTNAAVAIGGLKSEIRRIMVETADSIIAYHSNNRGHGRSSSTAQQERDSATFSAPSPPAEDVSRYTMADAAHLLQVTAKEGDPVAQRELATLYLTHPELMDRIIAPFARPKDVFRDELEGKWKKNQDPHRMDPTLMCVAHHWMSLSSKGGDLLAKEYLRQREEMDSF
ncbi:hypothetical protein Slin15195_G045000 [Septoria linicola]|uniref:Uncharacterized protein n=1 Tax=Septoria linicola TaxID=215465 RepID=A0A9Q9EGV7_9PEZI|nr:hypothetical protein Slin14017_G048520 [Septoria linicola]USW51181.1 hypothetical protein Slin15195_G045000 [Septoria linicola]